MKEAVLYKKTKKGKRIILKNMKVTRNSFEKGFGLMFARKKKCRRGMYFEFLKNKEVQFGASITMFFCFCSLDIIFVNKKGVIVDKVVLKPFKWNYTPKKKCLYVVETLKNGFSDLKIGDRVEVKF
jgi:uncharacterized membrane protein (UPF0127 family)